MFPTLLLALLTSLALAAARVTSRGHGYGIVGGVPAKITELPHQVYLRDKSWGFYCGGSIISKIHILTAGTCGIGLDPDEIEVVLGTDNRTAGDEQIFQVAKITVHENYTLAYSEITNDLAVLTLAKEISFSDKAKTIPLAQPQHEVKDGTELIVSGFGRASIQSYEASDILRKVSVPKLSLVECRQAYSEINITVADNQICAGGEAGKAVLHGDGGGALIEVTKDGSVQVGVASWGYAHAEGGFPDVYVEVSKYNDWINNIVKQDLKTPLGFLFGF